MTPDTPLAILQRPTRFVVGIDLGTTNSAVCYVDAEGEPTPRQFAIPQLVAAGEVGAAELLPSFCYLAGTSELPAGALELPWNKDQRHAVGRFAQVQGAAIPDRLVASAKSWLAHAGVDRTRGILPWGADLGEQMVSPVEVSARYLAHVRAAWDHSFGHLKDQEGTPCVLGEQQVILTVPASFDEVARQLTLEAATQAGLQHVVLIEEPLAAFYSWLWHHEEDWRELVEENETILVVDVGGGTTDFSLVQIEPGFSLRRTAVGEHLLLGGDNMDMSLARDAEAAWNSKLGPREWSQLCLECRRVKESLLAVGGPETADIAVAGQGRSLIASTRTHSFDRDLVVERIRDGFFPEVDVATARAERSRGIRQMGLPYASDPAVTRHLLHFLRGAAATVENPVNGMAAPSRILFNGGAMLPTSLRDRVRAVVASWTGRDTVPELAAADLNLAVSRGAAYYGLVRMGQGVRVKGGIARAYYLEVGSGDDSRLICVMPRDTQEGVVRDLPDMTFELATNQPVRFPIAASTTRLGDALGDTVEPDEEIRHLPPLHTVIPHGKGGSRSITVRLSTELNEVGTLEVWCSSLDGRHRYPLSFDLRSDQENGDDEVEIVVDEERRTAALSLVARAFGDEPDLLKRLPKDLESCLDLPRKDWGAALLRQLADALLEVANRRVATARHEARWLNLTGFCLRPGFGMPGDDWRLRQLWKLWHTGCANPRDAQAAADWWTLWRRVAGGLRQGHQQQIANILVRELVPKPGDRLDSRRGPAQETIEMWRCLGAMERLPVKTKLKTVRALLDSNNRLDDHHFWVLARLAARRLFHGPEDTIVPAAKLEPLLPELLKRANQARSHVAAFAVVNACRRCEVRGLDVTDTFVDQADSLLERLDAPEEWRQLLRTAAGDSRSYQREVTGDALPLGLNLAEE
jgi:hypothetical protein